MPKNILKKENPYFESLAWILADNKVFLRIQRPDFFGDDISLIRPDIAYVNREHDQVSGFDVGPYGMQFRVVQPVFYNGQYHDSFLYGVTRDVWIKNARELKNELGI